MQKYASEAGAAPEVLPGLTAMRGIAAVAVVLFHIDVCLFYRELGTLLPKTESAVIANGYLWVDFFFILSGYVIHHAYAGRLVDGPGWRSAVGFWRSRFFRIYPLHLATLAFLVVAVIAAGALAPTLKDGSWGAFFDWSALPANVLLTHAMTPGGALSWNIVSWSIAAEWWAYLLAPLLIPLMAKTGRRGGWFCMAAGAGILAALYGVLGRDTLDVTFDYGVVRCVGGFLIGTGLYAVHRPGLKTTSGSADGLGFAALAGLAVVMHLNALDLLVIPLFAALVIACTAGNGLLNRILTARPLQYLGRISYSIYLVHGLVFMLFWFGAPASGLSFDTPLTAWSFAAAFLALTIAGASVSYRFIEVPGRSLGRSRTSASTPQLRDDVRSAGEQAVETTAP